MASSRMWRRSATRSSPFAPAWAGSRSCAAASEACAKARPENVSATPLVWIGDDRHRSTAAATEGILEAHRPTPTERLARLARAELDRAYRLAGLILGSAPDAEDAVGDALERAHRSIGRLRDEAQFQAWFDRIVVNACRDRLRRRRLVRFIPIDDAGERTTPSDPFAAVIESDAALRAIDVLPPDERAIVVLRFWADLQVDEIGRRLGIPAGTVKSRLHRALDRMKAAAE